MTARPTANGPRGVLTVTNERDAIPAAPPSDVPDRVARDVTVVPPVHLAATRDHRRPSDTSPVRRGEARATTIARNDPRATGVRPVRAVASSTTVGLDHHAPPVATARTPMHLGLVHRVTRTASIGVTANVARPAPMSRGIVVRVCHRAASGPVRAAVPIALVATVAVEVTADHAT